LCRRETIDIKSSRMATDYPVTMAIRTLRQHNVAFTPHLYVWEPRGGTRASAEHLGVDEHQVVKTLIFADESKRPLCILMHGDREVSAKSLARQLGHKSVAPCAPAVADRHSGYQVGGTSPFGLKRGMPVTCEKSIGDLPRVYINGGARGFLVGISAADLLRVLQPTLVAVAIP
jgi:Cys-tRNA(Pro) deacylase